MCAAAALYGEIKAGEGDSADWSGECEGSDCGGIVKAQKRLNKEGGFFYGKEE